MSDIKKIQVFARTSRMNRLVYRMLKETYFLPLKQLVFKKTGTETEEVRKQDTQVFDPVRNKSKYLNVEVSADTREVNTVNKPRIMQ